MEKCLTNAKNPVICSVKKRKEKKSIRESPRPRETPADQNDPLYPNPRALRLRWVRCTPKPRSGFT